MAVWGLGVLLSSPAGGRCQLASSCSGTTLLLVTHQIEAVIPEIQRCVMLKAGQLMADGPCDQVITSPNLSALFETPLQLLSANGYRQVLPG